MPDQYLSDWKPKYPLAEKLGEGVDYVAGALRSFAGPQPGVPEDPVLNKALNLGVDFLGLDPIARTAKRVAYGEPLTEGKNQTFRLKDDTVDTALAGLGAAGPALKASRGVAKLEGIAADKLTSAVVGKPTKATDVFDYGQKFLLKDAAAPNIFGGEKAMGKQYADELALAKKKEARGDEMNHIRQTTGWFKDPADGKWKREISDEGSLFTMLQLKHTKERGAILDIKKKLEDAGDLRDLAQYRYGDAKRVTPEIVAEFERRWNTKPHPEAMGIAQALTTKQLGDEISKIQAKAFAPSEYRAGDVIHHPEFFAKYPEARNWSVEVTNNLPREVGGEQLGDTIRLNRNLMRDEKQVRSIMLHEMEHGVQDIEGHGAGGSPRGIIESAKRLADIHKRDGDVYHNALLVRNYMKQHGVDSEDALAALVANNGFSGSLHEVNDKALKIRGVADSKYDPDADLVEIAKAAYERAKQVHIPTQEEALAIYNNLPGEAMSRNVQARADFTAYQRQTHDPLKHTSEGGTLDVKPEDIKVWKPAYQMGGSPAMPKAAVNPDMLGGHLKELKEKLAARDDILKDDNGHAVIVFRGTNEPEKHPLNEGRPTYAVFTSDNPYLASSFVRDPFSENSKVGAVAPMVIKSGVKVIEFPVREGRFDKFAFDEAAKRLKNNEVLVARNSFDSGPGYWEDPYGRATFPADQYAFKDPSVVEPLYRPKYSLKTEGKDTGWKEVQKEKWRKEIASLKEGLKTHPEGRDVYREYDMSYGKQKFNRDAASGELQRIQQKLEGVSALSDAPN